MAGSWPTPLRNFGLPGALPGISAFCNGKILDTTTASRRVIGIPTRGTSRSGSRSIGTGHNQALPLPVSETSEVAGLRPKSVQLILTDIPYNKQFLPQLDDLGRFAAEVLVAGGLFITFVGQFHLIGISSPSENT